MTTVIDAHVHIWSDDRQRFPMVAGRERAIGEPATAEHLIGLMDRHLVERTVLVQAPWHSEDNRYFVEAMSRYPGRFVGVGYLEDPAADDAAAKLEQQYVRDGFRGLRLHLTTPEVAHAMADGKMERLLNKAAELRVPIKLRAWLEHVDLVIQAASRFPTIPFILDHLMHPRASEAPAYAGASRLFELSSHSNVYVLLSEQHRMSNEGFPWTDTADFQKRLVKAFGCRRLMWGSDFPMRAADIPYASRLDGARRQLHFLGDDELEHVLYSTASSVWPA